MKGQWEQQLKGGAQTFFSFCFTMKWASLHNMTLHQRLRTCYLTTDSKSMGLTEYELKPPKQRAKIGPVIFTFIDSQVCPLLQFLKACKHRQPLRNWSQIEAKWKPLYDSIQIIRAEGFSLAGNFLQMVYHFHNRTQL